MKINTDSGQSQHYDGRGPLCNTPGSTLLEIYVELDLASIRVPLILGYGRAWRLYYKLHEIGTFLFMWKGRGL